MCELSIPCQLSELTDTTSFFYGISASYQCVISARYVVSSAGDHTILGMLVVKLVVTCICKIFAPA